jgi:hypothetical protein
MDDGNGYSVYLQALVDAAKSMDKAADDMFKITKVAGSAEVRAAASAFGVIGQVAKFPKKYTDAVDRVQRLGTQWSSGLHEAALELLRTEQHYAEKDAAWVRKFGITDDGKRPDAPDLGQGKTAKLR